MTPSELNALGEPIPLRRLDLGRVDECRHEPLSLGLCGSSGGVNIGTDLKGSRPFNSKIYP